MDREMTQRMTSLARRLLERTRAGDIEWLATDDDTTYLFGGDTASVTIDRFKDRQGRTQTVLRVLNNRGTEVERVSIIDGDIEYFAQDIADLLPALHAAARRQALNVDSVIEGLLEELD